MSAMLALVLVVLIAATIIGAGWYWRDALTGWRTVAFNAVSAVVVAAGPDLMSYLAGFDWGGLFSPSTAPGTRAALAVVLVMNIVNIALRLMTRGPVGDKNA